MALIDIMPRLNIGVYGAYSIPYVSLRIGIVAKIKGKMIGIISISAIFLIFFKKFVNLHRKGHLSIYKKWHLSLFRGDK